MMHHLKLISIVDLYSGVSIYQSHDVIRSKLLYADLKSDFKLKISHFFQQILPWRNEILFWACCKRRWRTFISSESISFLSVRDPIRTDGSFSLITSVPSRLDTPISILKNIFLEHITCAFYWNESFFKYLQIRLKVLKLLKYGWWLR